MTDDRARPEWAQRLQRERLARGWSQSDAVAAMRTFSDVPLPDGLVDQWKRWERGRNKPDEFYRPLIAATLGTIIESIFGEKRVPYRAQTTDDLLISRSGMDTLELVQRIPAPRSTTAPWTRLNLRCSSYAAITCGVTPTS